MLYIQGLQHDFIYIYTVKYLLVSLTNIFSFHSYQLFCVYDNTWILFSQEISTIHYSIINCSHHIVHWLLDFFHPHWF